MFIRYLAASAAILYAVAPAPAAEVQIRPFEPDHISTVEADELAPTFSPSSCRW